MSAPPYMRLYWADYHQDTRHLTRDEHGAYFLLLGEAWNRGGLLPDDDAMLARWALATADEWRSLKPIVMAFFKLSRGRWKHKRIAEELASYDDVARKRKAAGKRGGSASAGKDKENSQANAKQTPRTRALVKPEPEPEPEYVGGVEGARATSQTDDWPEDDLVRRLCAEADSPWLDPDKSAGLVLTAGRLAAWRRAGASWELHVVPVVSTLARQHGEPIASWQFFDRAIGRAVKAATADLELPDARVVPLRPGGSASIADQMADEHRRAEALAFQMLDAQNGRT